VFTRRGPVTSYLRKTNLGGRAMFRRIAATLTVSILLVAACTSAGAGPSSTSPGPGGSTAGSPTGTSIGAPAPTPLAPKPAAPSPGPGGWSVVQLAPAAGLAMPYSVTRLGDGYLAVGGPECARPTASAAPAGEVVDARLATTWTPNPWATPEPPKVCYGGVWWSPDGLPWSDLTLRLAVELGPDMWPEGAPDPGFRDVAARGDRVVIIGRDEAGPMAWWGDPTTGLRPVTNRDVFARAGLAAVTATASGFFAVGTDDSGAKPRAAAWSSADGSTWTRVADGPAFEVGTSTPVGMEGERITGGMSDIASGGPGLVAVGNTCDEWGACTAAAWWSIDGITWSRGDTASVTGRPGSIAVGPSGMLAVGGGSILASTDGKSWTSPLPAAGAGSFDRVAASATGFVALRASRPDESMDPLPSLWASADGVTWQPVADFPVFDSSRAWLAGADLVATPQVVVVWWEGESGGAWATSGPSAP